MRSWRMDQIPDLCDDAAYSAEIVFKICCAATTRKVPKSQTVDAGFGSRRGTGIYRGEGAPGSGIGRTGIILLRKLRPQGPKLLVLRFPRPPPVALGVVDHLTPQLLP